jgi:hypothetical protein
LFGHDYIKIPFKAVRVHNISENNIIRVKAAKVSCMLSGSLPETIETQIFAG